MITQEEIMRSQGTRLSDKAPWESYGKEMSEDLPDDLQEAIKHYEELRHAKTSSQNQELLAEQKELSDDVAKQYQFITPEEYDDLAARVGTVIHSSRFINMLRNECGIKCWYCEHPMPQHLTLVVEDPMGVKPAEIACWVQEGFMNEYSWMYFDDHGAPLSERRRGWRTCLLQMQLKQILTEDKVVEVFGRAEGPVSERYNKTLYEMRNKRIKASEVTKLY